MFSKANIISTIVTSIWGFGGGYLLWGLLGDSLLMDHLGSATGVMKDVPIMSYLVLGCIIYAFAFSTIYGKWANGEYGASSGLTFGILVTIMVGIGSGLIDFATANILSLSGVMTNAGIYLVFLAIMGILAGVVYSKTS